MKRRPIEEILIALSLSNLVFFPGWRQLVFPNSFYYVTKYFASYLDFLSIIFLVICLAGIFLAGLWLIRYLFKGQTPTAAKWLFLIATLVVLNIFRVQFSEYETIFVYSIGGRGIYLALLGIIALSGLVLALKWSDLIFMANRGVILILFPFVLITFFQAVVGAIDPGSQTAEPSEIVFSKPDPGSTENRSDIRSRVVWIVFDELDYRIPFELRPPGIQLPEFDRLRKESLFATNVVSPARDTLESIPSLLTGKTVKKSIPIGKSELLLNLAERNESIEFSKVNNVFREARKLGGETAVVGNYHSYCRVLRQDLSSCFWSGKDLFSKTFGEAIKKRLLEVVDSIPFGYRLLRLHVDEKADILDAAAVDALIQEKAKEIVINPEIDFAFIHLSIPHPPYDYNEKLKKLKIARSYAGNLVIADGVLGEIRKHLENANLWDNSTILVTSDHSWRIKNWAAMLTQEEIEITKRKEDSRIPFILKLKGQNKPIEYQKSFSSVIAADLLVSIMKGDVENADDAETWLRKNANSVVTP